MSSPTPPGPVADQFRYLYLNDERNKKGRHVIEHIAPPTREGQVSDRPDFLFSTTYEPKYRVVIFYIDWCPVCMGVVGEYVEFAERMKDYGVETHAVSCMAQTPLCLRLKLPGYPILRLYGPGEVGTDGQDLALAELNPLRVLEQFQIAIDDGDKQRLNETWTTASLTAAAASHNSGGWRERLTSLLSPRRWFMSRRSAPTYRRTSQEIESDVHRSLDATLRGGIFPSLEDPLTDEAGRALYEFLVMLDKVLPPTWNTLHGLIHEIVSNFVFATKSEAYLVSYLDRTPPASESWTPYCSHGSPTAGYSCGLWTLFHTATVGAAEFNSLSMQRNRMGTEVVARQIRNFVNEFFSCAECRFHFVSSFDACDHDRCRLLSLDGNSTTASQAEWRQLPLWLAKVHNSVNVRRASEIKSGKRKVSRREQPYQQMPELWPKPEDCPPCWVSGTSSTPQDQWSEDVVYQYLKLEYFTGHPNASLIRSGAAGTNGLAGSSTFRHDPGDVRLGHFLVSCALVAAAMWLWETARSSVLRVGDRLRRKIKV